MSKPVDHEHVIKGNGKGGTRVVCSQSPPCKVAKVTQGWINKGQNEDRAKGFRRAN